MTRPAERESPSDANAPAAEVLRAAVSPAAAAGDGAFKPHPLTVGGHAQTLLGYWVRSFLSWPHPVEDIVVEAGADVRLLVRATWQPRHAEQKPTLLVVHGLCGTSEGSYGLSIGQLAYALGWNVARMNLRGAGSGFSMCARPYNAGADSDVLAVLEFLARRTRSIAVAGFSLGANIATLCATRGAPRLPESVFAVAAVSPPLDLSACADAMDRGIFRQHYLRLLKADYRRRSLAWPELFPPGREAELRTIREYDDRITAVCGGFAGAADYYAHSSAGPLLAKADRPLLLLAAEDDPLIPAAAVSRWPLPSSGTVRRELLKTGGHVGFLAGSRAPGRFWAADRVMDFFTRCPR
jgi:predicted alpha/beta-fold hydrolase